MLTFSEIELKARIVVGRGEKSLLSDPGSEVRLGREKEKEKRDSSTRDEQRKGAYFLTLAACVLVMDY